MSERFPLYLALMWHMHQPYYKDIRTGKYIMPWVRLHATKDYLDMVLLLSEYPRIRSTFNMVPSLVEQIDDYVHGASDLALDISERPAELLNNSERKFILEKFFAAHFDNMIKPYERYRELFEKRGWAKTDSELERVAQYFQVEDMRDLQVWYNLSWIDPYLRSQDPTLMRLIHKERNFTEQEKAYVLRKHREYLERVVPTYREFQEKGQIEVTCTPFYHPILPLVYDTDLARVARPDIALPRRRFSFPEDANAQVASAVAYHEKMFGSRPKGMWPSEGSVAPEVVPFFANQGVQWIATDEEILGHSVGQFVRRDVNGVVQNPDLLYRPYWAEHHGNRVAMVFRDHFMSDLIGFQYAGWKSEDAAADLVSRLESVARSVRDPSHPYLVSIILDGENCWEHYAQDGLVFMRRFYELLSQSRLVETTRVSDFLERFPPTRTLPRLFTGSWINHDFRIWIGHREDNQSWDYLHEVRDMVAQHIERHRDQLTQQQIDTAWKEIFIAEGSDWNWWYGDDHSSGIDEEFDQLYRSHLISACEVIGLPPPSFLLIPITTHGVTGRGREPRAFIHPKIDGRNTTYHEWFAAGNFDPTLGGGSMHQAQYRVRRLYYGFDTSHLYFRFDVDHSVLKSSSSDRVVLNLALIGAQSWKVKIVLHGAAAAAAAADASNGHRVPQATLGREENSEFHPTGEITSVAFDQVVELAVPYSMLELLAGDELYFYAALEVNGREIERCPGRAPLRLEVPTADFETKMWMV